eukprot:2338572-Pyramimonas_sp.AAC.1
MFVLKHLCISSPFQPRLAPVSAKSRARSSRSSQASLSGIFPMRSFRLAVLAVRKSSLGPLGRALEP